MKITRVDELVSIVCDKLCKYPLMANSQEQLEEICADCPLVQAMLPDIRSDANRYERMAGTPERFADTLMQFQDGADLSPMYCLKAECRKKQDECGDFTCTDERLRGCILEWLSGDEHK